MSEFQTMTGPQPVKLTISDFELLLRSGALDRFQHVELIEGVIVELNAERVGHSRAKMAVTFRLYDALRQISSSLEVRCEPTIELSENSLPEPDIMIIEPVGGLDEYPLGKDVRIVVEIAHSSRVKDLGYKYRLYGKYRLPEYWIFDLNEDEIHVFWDPNDDGYDKQVVLSFGERLESRTIPGLSIDTSNLY